MQKRQTFRNHLITRFAEREGRFSLPPEGEQPHNESLQHRYRRFLSMVSDRKEHILNKLLSDEEE